MKRRKTQQQTVIEFVSQNGEASISDVQKETQILRPNIRRILGQGEKNGLFKRVAPGVYVLQNEAGNFAYVETADALQSLPRLRAQGWKFDAVFLDPPYFSKSLIGGNRGIVDYDFIFARQFATVMEHVAALLRDEFCHVYIMLSGAQSAQKEMRNYKRAAEHAGFKLCKAGTYKKLFSSGKPATNVRGDEASAEQLLLYTLSGTAAEYGCEIKMDFALIRPNAYQTEKPGELLAQVVRQSTAPNQTLLDCFAGSGVSGDKALADGRNAYLIEKNPAVVEGLILKRIK